MWITITKNMIPIWIIISHKIINHNICIIVLINWVMNELKLLNEHVKIKNIIKANKIILHSLQSICKEAVPRIFINGVITTPLLDPGNTIKDAWATNTPTNQIENAGPHHQYMPPCIESGNEICACLHLSCEQHELGPKD